ncbi:MAG: CopG family transcriptional regulator [Gemmatimonadetes bacterium]|nr:CopG family transcriptional regulator [Gemmatimonadota bacterium]
MPRSRIAVPLDANLLERLDRLVEQGVFSSRDQGIQVALEEKLERLEGTRLARECAKLDLAFESSLVEAGLAEDLEEWPEY